MNVAYRNQISHRREEGFILRDLSLAFSCIIFVFSSIVKINVGARWVTAVLTPLPLSFSRRFVDIYEVGEIFWFQTS